MGSPPLSDIQEINPRVIWMQNKGINALDQIASWNHEDNTWNRWLPPTFPIGFNNQLNLITSCLKGAVPISFQTQDKFKWNPTRGYYTVKLGYVKIQADLGEQGWIYW